jgi:hypothetical protein
METWQLEPLPQEPPLWASAAEAKPSTATVVKTKAKERIVEKAFIVKSPKREGDFLKRRIAFFTLSYGRLPGCYRKGLSLTQIAQIAEKYDDKR